MRGTRWLLCLSSAQWGSTRASGSPPGNGMDACSRGNALPGALQRELQLSAQPWPPEPRGGGLQRECCLLLAGNASGMEKH